ncbi:MAG: AarF/UbiB family protein [Myxococcota bacterium]
MVSTVRDIDRLRQILVVLARHGFGEIVQRTGLGRLVRPGESASGSTSDDQDQDVVDPVGRIEFGERLRLVLQDLGPSFIKLGQILSTRSDLIPEDIVEELAKLQDQVTPLPFDVIRSEVETELGAPLNELFARFDEQPLASASVAQVHRARLFAPEDIDEVDDETVEVVVKVQRPRIRNIVARDVELLHLLARAIERSIPESRIYSPLGLVNEFDRAISAELDFTREADHAERFRQGFMGDAEAAFPAIHRDLSSRRVLTMEFLDGYKLPQALEKGYRGPDLARVALRVIFKQIFEDGFFHGDPHPGNLLVMGDLEKPTLAMIDLGLVGRMSPNLRDKTVDLMLSAARRDSQGIADALYAIGTPTRKIDRNRYVAEVTFLSDRS